MNRYIYAVVSVYHDGAKEQTELRFFDTTYARAYDRARRWRMTLNKNWTVDILKLAAVETIPMEVNE